MYPQDKKLQKVSALSFEALFLNNNDEFCTEASRQAKVGNPLDDSVTLKQPPGWTWIWMDHG
jgi:hypothetical protein